MFRKGRKKWKANTNRSLIKKSKHAGYGLLISCSFTPSVIFGVGLSVSVPAVTGIML